MPYSAVLWRDGVSTNIDVNDPRLIMLVNMYNNSMYHHEFAQTEELLNNADYTKYVDAPVRLELTFERDHRYTLNNNVVYNDKIIISCPKGEMGGFVVIYFNDGADKFVPHWATDTDAPEWALMRFPYEMYYMDWLRLVGFVE